MSATQQVTGIASGFDTASIVEKLMQIEKIPYDKLDVKKQTQQLKLQAYQAVNSMLLKFRTSVGTLSSQKLWRSKSATSTNDKVLTATANEYAVNGSYSFKVAQLATATQFMSKGFASSKTAIVKQATGEAAYKVGSISMNSAKSRVDTSAKIDTLNGGKGVYRGSVRVTDGANRTSIIDLSGCDTIDDVVRTLNESTGAQITASIQDGRLHIVDESGGTGLLKIQNVGTGTTATDLGINMSSDTGAIAGRNVYTLGNDTSLTMLNDGLGVEEGVINFRVSDSQTYMDIKVNVDDCATVGDIINRVNQEIEHRRANNIVDANGGGSGAALLDGLRFGLNAEKDGFALTGTKANHSYSFSNYWSDGTIAYQEAATQLGLDGKTYTSAADGAEISFKRVLGDINSPMLKNLSGVNGTGVGSSGGVTRVPVKLDLNTKASWLNNGRGVDISRPLSIQLTEGGPDASGGAGLQRVYDDIIDMDELRTFMEGDPTVVNLLGFMNSKLAAYAADPDNNAAGLTGMRFAMDETNQCIVVDGVQGGYKVEIGGSMAADLGLARADQLGTSIFIDPDFYGDYDARIDALSNFYGVDSGADPADALTDGAINLDPAKGDLTTLYDLANLYGADIDFENSPDPQAEVNAWLTDMFGNNKLDLKVTEHLRDSDGNITGTRERAVEVDLSGLNFDGDTTVDSFLNDVNAAIQTAFDDQAQANGWDKISAPELRVHTYGDRLQWSNMDFTKDFAATGDLADAFNVDRSIAAADVPVQAPDVIRHSYNAMAPGYYESLEISEANGDNVQLGNLRGGAMLTFAGNDSDELVIDLGDDKVVRITREELINAINTPPNNSLNTTLTQYVAALNGLVDAKLQDVNNGVAEEDKVSFKFRIGDGKLEIADLQNADRLKVSGAMADTDRTGIGPVDVATVEAGKAYGTGTLSAVALRQDELTGLGSIHVKLGGVEAELQTDGLDGDSTLADLVDKLNDELRRLSDPGDPKYKGDEFKNIRFTINDAGTGIAVDNSSAEVLEFVDSKSESIARDLGLVNAEGEGVTVDTHSFHNSGSLGRKYVSRSTLLSDYIGANGSAGSIQITNAFGVSWTADLSNCKTVGDVLDFINKEQAFGVQIELNEMGDGFRIYEAYSASALPETAPTGNISISDVDGGTIAKKLGIAGTGVRDPESWGGNSVYEASQKTVIDVMSTDTLESLMYRISEKGYKTAIINDGSSTNPYRLTISSTTTGEASDFVIESDLDIFGFNQTSRARDSKVLYGDPNSSASPIMLSSSTNSNSNAILGLTLEFKSVSNEFVTITVDTDKEKVVEEIKNMVQTYNDLNDLISYLDAYDEESGEPGVLFGDTSVRTLMEDINDMFYLIFNPNQKQIGSTNDQGVLNTWTWMDMGVSLSAKNSASDGSGNWYSSMDLDLDKLDEMVAKNWDILYNMLAGQRNASDSTLEDSVRATATFNGKAAGDFKAENAINGDSNKGSWGINNGFMADGTIADGENEYTIYFQKPTTISRMSIYHYDTDTALKNFTVEYLDASTGKWETLRDIKNNSVDANHLGMDLPTAATAIRIKATSTNAEDGKFRLLDVQVFEDIGLAGQLNNLTSKLGDTQLGFLAERSDEIDSTLRDIEEQMLRLQERLDLKEESLWKRFTAMETALGQLQNQSNYFSTMMDSMSSSKK